MTRLARGAEVRRLRRERIRAAKRQPRRRVRPGRGSRSRRRPALARVVAASQAAIGCRHGRQSRVRVTFGCSEHSVASVHVPEIDRGEQGLEQPRPGLQAPGLACLIGKLLQVFQRCPTLAVSRAAGPASRDTPAQYARCRPPGLASRRCAACRACSRTNGWFIRNSACGATVLTFRRPVTMLGSAKSNTSNSSGSALRKTGA